MNMPYNTGIRVIVSDQGSRCQANVLVPHESMSYTGCQDQVSSMTSQVPVSNIKCRGLGIKYNI